MVSVHCGNMTLGKVHDTSLSHEQLGEILLTSDGGIRSYGPDTKWIDGQTGLIYNTPNFVCGGYKYCSGLYDHL